MLDHEIALTVNALRNVAQEFGQTEQLRERLGAVIVPHLRRLQVLERVVAQFYSDMQVLQACVQDAEVADIKLFIEGVVAAAKQDEKVEYDAEISNDKLDAAIEPVTDTGV